MRNHTPWWKWLVIAVVILPGAFYALPNLFGDDPGIQLRGARGGSLGASQFEQVQKGLDEAGLGYDSTIREFVSGFPLQMPSCTPVTCWRYGFQ